MRVILIRMSFHMDRKLLPLPGLRRLQAALLLALASPGAAAVVAVAASEEVPAQPDAGSQTLEVVQVTGSAADNDYNPSSSTIGAKVPTPLRGIPQSVTVIDRAMLEAQGATSLADALRNVPGITISGAEGGQIGNNINLRGFAARTDIYVDGMRDRGQYYRDTYYLESVEVLKGPSSMLFGRGSTGGVIKQVSKKPELKDKNEVTATIGTDTPTTLSPDAQLFTRQPG